MQISTCASELQRPGRFSPQARFHTIEAHLTIVFATLAVS